MRLTVWVIFSHCWSSWSCVKIYLVVRVSYINSLIYRFFPLYSYTMPPMSNCLIDWNTKLYLSLLCIHYVCSSHCVIPVFNNHWVEELFNSWTSPLCRKKLESKGIFQELCVYLPKVLNSLKPKKFQKFKMVDRVSPGVKTRTSLKNWQCTANWWDSSMTEIQNRKFDEQNYHHAFRTSLSGNSI